MLMEPRLSLCVRVVCMCVIQCMACYQMRRCVNVIVCYLSCVCHLACADRQPLLRTFKCLLIAAIT